MRIVRFSLPTDPAIRWGLWEGDHVHELTAPPWSGGEATTRTINSAVVRLHAPVTPSKVIAIGRNSPTHATEMGWDGASPVLFLKPVSSVIGPEEHIVLPYEATRCEPEGELALVIGRGGRRLSVSDAQNAIAGYTIANDVSARDLMVSDGQWSRAKGFDTFCPVGPWVDTDFDTVGARIRTTIGAEIVQDGRIDEMVWNAARVVSFASTVFRLEPGDLILTGSPHGRRALAHGDHVEVEIPGLGLLRNSVVAESTAAVTHRTG